MQFWNVQNWGRKQISVSQELGVEERDCYKRTQGKLTMKKKIQKVVSKVDSEYACVYVF